VKGVKNMGYLIAALSGILMSLQGILNTEVTKQTSVWVSAAWVQATALAVSVIAWRITEGSSFLAIKDVTPRYMLFGGVIGAFITITVIMSMGSVGPAQATMFIVVAQVIFSWLVELAGLFGVEKTSFSWSKAVGMVLAIAGMLIFKWERS
jgi:transporter family-2 protein